MSIRRNYRNNNCFYRSTLFYIFDCKNQKRGENPMKNILEVKNISYSVGENKILKDISFKCQSGEIIGIIGPNGSGKTTLLKTINGINSISSGDILLNGKSIT